jgi:sugar O-acyltransferase (sialic acid O-acetyltransferase NeuD family)
LNEHINHLPAKMIVWGGTGQAKVVRPIIEHYGSRVVAVFDDAPDLPPPFPDVPLYQGWVDFPRWAGNEKRLDDIGFCLAIGNPHGRVRMRFHERLIAEGLQPVALAHPTAEIADNAVIGMGCQFMAGAIVNPEAVLGRQCIINTKASVDHECVLEDGCELGPGATLCGLVKLNINVWVCAGATVLPRISIGADTIVGAGAVVIRDVPAGMTVVGAPARPLEGKGDN